MLIFLLLVHIASYKETFLDINNQSSITNLIVGGTDKKNSINYNEGDNNSNNIFNGQQYLPRKTSESNEDFYDDKNFSSSLPSSSKVFIKII